VRIVPPTRHLVVVRGPGPKSLRIVLAVSAVLYYLALLKHPPQSGPLRPFAFFTECTCLFPGASTAAIEYRLEGWSCSARAWQPLDPRPYFPIEADDKESRFQRLGHFYSLGSDTHDKRIAENSREVMHALEAYILERHADASDAIAGTLGGIRLYRVAHAIPSPGADVSRYVYEPLAPAPEHERKDLYYTRQSDRNRRCEASP
jgi:hypothetical protein